MLAAARTGLACLEADAGAGDLCQRLEGGLAPCLRDCAASDSQAQAGRVWPVDLSAAPGARARAEREGHYLACQVDRQQLCAQEQVSSAEEGCLSKTGKAVGQPHRYQLEVVNRRLRGRFQR